MNILRRWAVAGIATALLGTAVMGPRPAQASVGIPNISSTDWGISGSVDHTYATGLRILVVDGNGNFTGYLYLKNGPAIPMTGVVSPGLLLGGNPIAFTAQNGSTVFSYSGTVDATNPSAPFMAGAYTMQTPFVATQAVRAFSLSVPKAFFVTYGPWPFCAQGSPTIQ